MEIHLGTRTPSLKRILSEEEVAYGSTFRESLPTAEPAIGKQETEEALGKRGSATIASGRLMGKEGAKRAPGQKANQALRLGRRGAGGRPGGCVPDDLARGTEQSGFICRLLRMACSTHRRGMPRG